MAVKNVQGLRAVAALMVVAAHIGGSTGVEAKLFGANDFWVNLADVGRTGVDLFFIISGFIMIVTTARVRHGIEGAGTFLRRRITRIYPPYLVITAAIFAVYLLRPDLVNVSQTVEPNVIASFLMLPQAGLPLLLVGWTLVFEMYFYLVLAITLLLPKRAFWPSLAAWALLTIALGALPQTNPYLELVSSPLNIEFLLGAVVGGLFLHKPLRAALGTTILGAAGTVAVSAAVLSGHDPYRGTVWLQVATTGLAFALILYGLACLEAQRRFVFHRLLVGLGNSSYSLYLTHVGVFKVMTLVLAKFPLAGLAVQILSVPFALAAAVFGGLVYYAAVERPLLRLLHSGAVGDKVAAGSPSRVTAQHQ